MHYLLEANDVRPQTYISPSLDQDGNEGSVVIDTGLAEKNHGSGMLCYDIIVLS